MSIAHQLQAQLNMLKFGNIVERQVAILNERRAEGEPELIADTFVDELMSEMQSAHGDPDQYDTFAKKLEVFKADISPETWEDVKGNPALESMVNEHVQNVMTNRGEACIKQMLEKIKEANEEQDEPLTPNDLKFIVVYCDN